jgi:hypothetical protein
MGSALRDTKVSGDVTPSEHVVLKRIDGGLGEGEIEDAVLSLGFSGLEYVRLLRDHQSGKMRFSWLNIVAVY